MIIEQIDTSIYIFSTCLCVCLYQYSLKQVYNKKFESILYITVRNQLIKCSPSNQWNTVQPLKRKSIFLVTDKEKVLTKLPCENNSYRAADIAYKMVYVCTHAFHMHKERCKKCNFRNVNSSYFSLEGMQTIFNVFTIFDLLIIISMYNFTKEEHYSIVILKDFIWCNTAK